MNVSLVAIGLALASIASVSIQAEAASCHHGGVHCQHVGKAPVKHVVGTKPAAQKDNTMNGPVQNSPVVPIKREIDPGSIDGQFRGG